MLILIALSAEAQTVTQTFNLRPGWNAIFLEVQPDNDDPAAVFGSIPNLVSVWMWNGKAPGRDFITDVNEAVIRDPGWLRWLPSSLTFLANLHSVRAHKAFLIHIGGTANQTWSVTGIPSTRELQWVPDSMNLVGLQVDPSNRPSFGTYLASSPAHAGRPVYTLDAPGVWRLVTSSETIEPGVAYWFDVRGASTFQGPIAVAFDGIDSLEFGQTIDERRVTASTLLGANGTVSLRLLSAPNIVPLRYFSIGTNGAAQWTTLPNPLSVTVKPGQTANVRLAIDRIALSADRSSSLLEATTSAGGRWLIPVGASRTNSASTITGLRGRIGTNRVGTSQTTASNVNAGLWVGTAVVNKVSNAQTASTTPVPTEFPFTLRMIVHVDKDGAVKFLKEATQMWRDGTSGAPGSYVLVTRDDKIGQYSGASLLDGAPVGHRVSSAGFDFAGDTLAMTGTFGTSTLTCTIDIPQTFPTNPFRHKFHPDHNNSNSDTAFDITRTLTLTFSTTDPDASPAPGFGASIMGGKYEEKVSTPTGKSGLHKNDIYAEGTFRLERVSLVNALNP